MVLQDGKNPVIGCVMVPGYAAIVFQGQDFQLGNIHDILVDVSNDVCRRLSNRTGTKKDEYETRKPEASDIFSEDHAMNFLEEYGRIESFGRIPMVSTSTSWVSISQGVEVSLIFVD